MHHSQNDLSFLKLSLFRSCLTFILISGAGMPAALVHAETTASIVTNLAQLAQVTSIEKPAVANVKLDATVYACDTNTGVLILHDKSGAELLEVEGLHSEFQPGDLVRIECDSSLLSPGDMGIYASALPLLNNDGVHTSRTVSCEHFLKAGRYPVVIDWFNQFLGSDLALSCTAAGSRESPESSGMGKTNLIHFTKAECFEGSWSKLPNFRMFNPTKVGTISNLDIGFRTRNELVGIRFEGYFDAPRTGTYHFSLRSDDGSRLWIGKPDLPVKKIGTNTMPLASPELIGKAMTRTAEGRLTTLEGRITFISRSGKEMRFELRSDENSASVAIANADSLNPADLLNAYVRVSGVSGSVLTEQGQTVLGTLAVANSKQLTVLKNPPGRGPLPSKLTTVMEVQSLSRDDAARQRRVAIHGVVTTVGQFVDRWMVVQDETRGIFVQLAGVTNCSPNVGEFWKLTGFTRPGDFAPVIVAESATLLGKGQMPNPIHPTWNQLINGSEDVQWAEIQGLVTDVQSNSLSLLLPEGHLEISLPGWGTSDLKRFANAVIQIRGVLFAVWEPQTHEVQVGRITMRNASITVDKPAPADPFDAPEKTPRGLFQFDVKASPFQRVKVRGQVTYADSKRVFIEEGSGIQILPTAYVKLNPGDFVEAVGYPEIYEDSPILREAMLRKIGDGVLTNAPLVSDTELANERLASRRVRFEGILAGLHLEENTMVLEMRADSRLLLARVANAKSLYSLRLGSKLSVTGIDIFVVSNDGLGGSPSHDELLINGPEDVAVITQPSWWTLRRLLSALGILLATLALAVAWIMVLRRQIEQRTMQLQHQIRERESIERQHVLETERSRIARDLHDDLGSSLTEINVLASTGQRPHSENNLTLFRTIGEKAQALVAALDVIVWAVDPEDNSLQSLSDYLGGYAREYLTNSSITCRFKIPITLPTVILGGRVRHEVFLAVKETLNNIVRHAGATEVEFQITIDNDTLEIRITDNGKGFDPKLETDGYGLKNRLTRLTKIGGSCDINSRTSVGTTVRILLPLPSLSACTARD